MRAIGSFIGIFLMALFSLSALAAAPPQPKSVPMTTLMKTSDVIAFGVIESIQIDTSRSLGVTSEGHVIRAFDVRLHVLNSLPPLKDGTITFSNRGDPTIRYFNVGREVIVCLKRSGGSYRRNDQSGIWGIFPVDGTGEGRLIRLAPHFHVTTPERAWEHVQAIYKQMNGPRDPDRNRARLDTLKSGSLIEAYLALEELTAPPQRALTSGDLVDALEIQYRRVRGGVAPGIYELNDLTRSAAKILAQVADDQAVSRTLALYIEDRTDLRGALLAYFNWDYNMLRFVLKHPGPSRAACVRSLLGREVEIYDRKKKIGKTVLVPVDETSLRILAQTPGADIDELLKDYLSQNPDFREEILKSRAAALKHPIRGESDFD